MQTNLHNITMLPYKISQTPSWVRGSCFSFDQLGQGLAIAKVDQPPLPPTQTFEALLGNLGGGFLVTKT